MRRSTNTIRKGLSYAFGIIGYSASFSGAGDTEAARWNDSVKYTYQYGRLHAGAMYSNGGPDTGIFGQAYGFDVAGGYRGFSADASTKRGATWCRPRRRVRPH